jgi:pilus assembly protein CpaE
MSSEMNTPFNVLLPAARVDLFTQDAQTRKTFEALASDWRFARIELTVYEGGADEAIETYKTQDSAALVIIQTEIIEKEFTDKLEVLAEYCIEGTAAMVIGPVNDVNLYRHLIGMGVSDYLVKPLNEEQFSQDIGQNLLQRMGTSESRLIVTLGAKGGVGATSLAQMMAQVSSDQLKQKTFLCDAAGGWSSMAVALDFEPSSTMADILHLAQENKTENLARLYFQVNERLTVPLSGSDKMLDDRIDVTEYENYIDQLMQTYPVVIVDLSSASPHLKQTMMQRANVVYLITAPSLTSVRAARSLMHEVSDLRGGALNNVHLVLNMQGTAPKFEVSKADIEEGLGAKVAASIPFAPQVFLQAEAGTKKIADDKEGSAILSQVHQLLGLSINVLPSHAIEGRKSAPIGKILGKITGK